MRIAIIGTGRMGSLFARYFMSNNHTLYVYDKNEKNINKLLDEGANKIELSQLNEMDLVMICVPLEDTSKVIKQTARYMKSNTILTEISSIKHDVYHTLKSVCKRYALKPLSIHPLFGQGIRSFEDAKIILIPTMDEMQEYEYAIKLFANAKIIKMNYKEHDKAMAIILGLTHLTNFIIAKVISDEDYTKLKELGGTTFRLQSILLESIMNDDPHLSIALLSNPFMKKYTRRFMRQVEYICNAVMNDKKRYLLNSYYATKTKFAKKSNLEASYRMMYDILEQLRV